jgi:hypothetical protein
MALANAFFGRYTPDPARPLVGHAIRREGGSGLSELPEFKPDLFPWHIERGKSRPRPLLRPRTEMALITRAPMDFAPGTFCLF